ncbi:MAG: hypothetical protein J5590_02280 [Clostridia bacterium]|nr:hypothetical protein [Clostridia bacterium]
MKNRISIILAVCMLLACISPVIADNDTVDLVTFNSLEDFSTWKRRSFDVTGAHKSQEAVRVGEYSLKMIDFDTELSWSTPVNKSTAGMSYINMWMYCDNPNNVTIDFRPTIGGTTVNSLWKIKFDFTGWKCFSFPLNELRGYSGGAITKVCFSTEGYGFGARGTTPVDYIDNTRDKLQAAYVYLNHMWLSKEAPAGSDFGVTNIKDGAKLVKQNLPKIQIAAPGIVESSLKNGSVTVEPEVAFHTEIDDVFLNIVFDEDLDFSTDYTVSIDDGFYDNNGLSFSEKTISFRTRGESENIPPDVELTSPGKGERFFPDDTITLKANASDADGSVSYVEFYCDGKLIEGSRTYSGTDEYSFEWTNLKENLNGNIISAAAYDNKGKEEFSYGVRIKIADYHAPAVTMDKPENGMVVYNSISGVAQPVSIDLKTTASDIDGTVQSVNFFLDGELIYTEAENATAAAYTYTNELVPGEHIFSAVAEDDDGLTAEAETTVNVIDLGKQFPQLKIKSTENDYTERNCRKKLSSGVWQVDARLVLKDNKEHKLMLVGTAGYEVLTFAADGSFKRAGKPVNAKKSEDGIYDVSVIVNADKSVAQCVVNGEAVVDDISATGFDDGASLTLDSADESNAYIDTCAFYRLGEAANLSYTSLFDEDGNEIPDITAADTYTDSILVELEDGLSEETLGGNVSVVDKLTGEKVPVTVKGNKTYLLSKLKSDYEYLLKIGSDISDLNGRGLGGDKIFELKTKKNPVTVSYNSPMNSLASDTTSVYVDVLFKNNTDSATKSDIICVVYDGNKMKQYIVENVSIPANGQRTRTMIFSLENAVTENTYVEVFAVESEDTLLPVSDTIFRLVYDN